MKLFKLRSLAVATLLVFAISCSKDDDVSPDVANNSVTPTDFLVEKTYKELKIEVAYVEGYEPSTTSLNNVVSYLSNRLNKSGGITITKRTIPATTGRATVDVDAIRAIERAQRKSVTSGGTLTAWVMFLDVEYEESTNTQKVLGLTYGASSIAVFERDVNKLAANSPSLDIRPVLETVILDHEFGHVMGLVGNGIPVMNDHKDPDHGAHCSNTECLMYWKTEASLDYENILATNSYPALDANCLADLKAAGGK